LAQLKSPFVESKPENVYLSDRSTVMKKKQAVSVIGNCLKVIKGPKNDRGIEQDKMQEFQEQISTQTVSTYPLRGNTRQGDPICDRYGITVYENRIICVVADGCNWGERPRWAAEKCRNIVQEHLTNNIESINTVQESQCHLLISFLEAQRAICAEDPDCVCRTLVNTVLLKSFIARSRKYNSICWNIVRN